MKRHIFTIITMALGPMLYAQTDNLGDQSAEAVRTQSIEEVLSALKDIIPITYEFVDKDIYIKEQQKDHK